MVSRFDIHLSEVAAQATAVIRRSVQISELATAIPASCDDVRHFLRHHGMDDSGREIVFYTTSDEHLNLDVEIGVVVDKPFDGNGYVYPSSVPTGYAVHCTHYGPYLGVTAVHIAIRLWCLEHGYEHDEICWEIYGEYTTDPEKLRADVYYLLSNKK